MAGARISIEIDDASVTTALNALLRRIADPAPALRNIGEEVAIQTKERIESGGPSPSGTPWAPLLPVTIARKEINKDRVLYYHGDLLRQIFPQLGADGRSVEVGTDRPYGAAMQFGMPKGYAGTTKRGAPIPWGDISPRPFLGLSSSDRDSIVAILRTYLETGQ
jgi:phage gpG-like protein